MLRNKQGKFRQSYLDRYYGLILLIETVALGLVLHRIGDPVQLPFSPKAPPMVIKQVFASETVTEPPSDILGYIRYKFGEDADKAIELLTGEGCSENKTLNPNAVNDNRTWGGVGRDRGYWQINDVYHPSVSDECAKDVKCSTDYAFRMYKNDNNSFHRWTCGRVKGL